MGQIIVVSQSVQARARATKISSSEVGRDEGMASRYIDPLRIRVKTRRDAKDPLVFLVHIRIGTSLLFGLSFRSLRSCLKGNGRERRGKLQRTC